MRGPFEFPESVQPFRRDFGIEVFALETESGFFNAEIVVWVQDIPTTVNEALTCLATSLANILSQARRAELDLPPDWSPARVAWHLLGRERTDIEDEQLFAHLALPILDSARERVFFISRASSTELARACREEDVEGPGLIGAGAWTVRTDCPDVHRLNRLRAAVQWTPARVLHDRLRLDLPELSPLLRRDR